MRTIYSICVSVGEELQGFGSLPLEVLSGFESFPKAISDPSRVHRPGKEWQAWPG